MITIDLIRKQAWQRCWDIDDCLIRSQTHPQIFLQAKHKINPPENIPTSEQLAAFEETHAWTRPPGECELWLPRSNAVRCPNEWRVAG